MEEEGVYSQEETLDTNKAEHQAGNPCGVDIGHDPAPETGSLPFHYNGIHYDMLTKDDMLGKEFKTVEEAELFYYSYAECTGFHVRRQDIKYGQEGRITNRQYVCTREGKRRAKWLNTQPASGRRQRAITRENCKAAFRIKYLKKTDTYQVSEFIPEHSHPLSIGKEAVFLPSQRHLLKESLAQATEIQRVSVRKCQSVNQSGDYAKFGFTINDFYKNMDIQTRETLKGGDVEAAFFYMQAKTTSDPNFFCKFTVDEENKLANLFWRDSTSLAEYFCFGDILIFDSTCKTNQCGKPVVFFVGVNNHRGNVLFASAFLKDGTAKSYEWVLKTFLSSMNEKQPISVVTDGDEAIGSAIDEVLPEAYHRLCAWHVEKNAKLNLHFADHISLFKKCIYEAMSPIQFEQLWQDLVATLPPECNDWVKMMYGKKQMWSTAFLAGYFFSGLQSMQHVDGLHSSMKDFLRRNHMKIYECLPQIDRAVACLRHDCALADYEANGCPLALCTELHELEKHAATIYTRSAFERVQEQIKLVGRLKCKPPVDLGHCVYYTISKYGEVGSEWVVCLHQEGVYQYVCPCEFFETDGIPCSHMFCAMKEAELKNIPEAMIKTRWTKDPTAGIQIPSTLEMVDSVSIQTARYNALSSFCSKLCFFGSRTLDGFNMVKSELTRITAAAESISIKHQVTGLSLGRQENMAKDPQIVKSKRKRTTDQAEVMKSKPRQPKSTGCKEYAYTAVAKDDYFSVGVSTADEESRPITSTISPGTETSGSLSRFDEYGSGKTKASTFPTWADLLVHSNSTGISHFKSQESQNNPSCRLPRFNI